MNPNYKDKIERLVKEYTENINSLEKIIAFTEYLLLKNNELNLVSRKLSMDDLITDHIEDSLSGCKYFRDYSSITDLGSGGGFPGIILAVIFPEKKITLVEKSPKKSQFLNDTVKHLGLKNVTVKNELLESIKIKEGAVTCRAFKEIPVILDMTKVFFNNRGLYILYKGKLEKINEEILTAGEKYKFVYKIDKVDAFKEKERHIVLINKE
jgi:16S rRNA (guanine527-N7)-methyltransferase